MPKIQARLARLLRHRHRRRRPPPAPHRWCCAPAWATSISSSGPRRRPRRCATLCSCAWRGTTTAPDSIASSRTSWCKVGREGVRWWLFMGQVWLAMRCTWAARGGCWLHCCCAPRPQFNLNPSCARGVVAGGDPTGTGNGGESIYGRPFKDEFHSRLKFNHRQALPHCRTTSVLSGTCSVRPRPRLPALLFAAVGPHCAGSADLLPARRTPQGPGGVRQPQRA